MYFQDNQYRYHSNCPKCNGDILYNWDLDKYHFQLNGDDPDCLCRVPICEICDQLDEQVDFRDSVVIDGKSYENSWICQQCLESENNEIEIEIKLKLKEAA